MFDAYFDLATCRGVDGAIPWRDMVAYADRAGLEEDVGQAFVRIMRTVDSEKISRQRKTNAAQPETVTAKKQSSVPETTQAMPTANKETMRAAAMRRIANTKKV